MKKQTHDNKHGESLVGSKVAHGWNKLRRRQRRRQEAVEEKSEGRLSGSAFIWGEQGSGPAGRSPSGPLWPVSCFTATARASWATCSLTDQRLHIWWELMAFPTLISINIPKHGLRGECKLNFRQQFLVHFRNENQDGNLLWLAF